MKPSGWREVSAVWLEYNHLYEWREVSTIWSIRPSGWREVGAVWLQYKTIRIEKGECSMVAV